MNNYTNLFEENIQLKKENIELIKEVEKLKNQLDVLADIALESIRTAHNILNE